jgi:hypothetical protein
MVSLIRCIRGHGRTAPGTLRRKGRSVSLNHSAHRVSTGARLIGKVKMSGAPEGRHPKELRVRVEQTARMTDYAV